MRTLQGIAVSPGVAIGEAPGRMIQLVEHDLEPELVDLVDHDEEELVVFLGIR